MPNCTTFGSNLKKVAHAVIHTYEQMSILFFFFFLFLVQIEDPKTKAMSDAVQLFSFEIIV